MQDEGGVTMSFPWYVPAVAAALVWGLHYPLIEHALKRVSLPTVVLLTALPMALAALAFPARLHDDWRAVMQLPAGDRAHQSRRHRTVVSRGARAQCHAREPHRDHLHARFHPKCLYARLKRWTSERHQKYVP
jgi:hypothetical protein